MSIRGRKKVVGFLMVLGLMDEYEYLVVVTEKNTRREAVSAWNEGLVKDKVGARELRNGVKDYTLRLRRRAICV